MADHGSSAPMRFQIRRRHGPAELPIWLPEPERVSAWLRDGEGLVGWGAAATFRPTGRGRFAEAQHWWDDIIGHAVVEDTSNIRDNGPVALVKLAYADSSLGGWCRTNDLEWDASSVTRRHAQRGPSARHPSARRPAGHPAPALPDRREGLPSGFVGWIFR